MHTRFSEALLFANLFFYKLKTLMSITIWKAYAGIVGRQLVWSMVKVFANYFKRYPAESTRWTETDVQVLHCFIQFLFLKIIRNLPLQTEPFRDLNRSTMKRKWTTTTAPYDVWHLIHPFFIETCLQKKASFIWLESRQPQRLNISNQKPS